MKPKIFKRFKQAASALLTALILCSIFSLFVVYYLTLIEQQNVLNSRSQAWNMAIAITEAGIEEGMEHLNDNTANLAIAPWSYLGGSTYYRSNTLPDGTSYTVFITNTIPTPVVVSRAYVQMGSFLNLAQRVAEGFYAAAGVTPPSSVVTRAVQVNCIKTSLYLVPLVARKNINLNGNNIATDSFNSCDPAKSVNGQYSPAIAGDRGDIASNLGVIDSISGGNANIYGKAHTGISQSGQPTVSIGPNGAVGSHSWQTSNKGLEDGWVLQDANFTFPDTSFPSTSGFMTATGGVLVVSTATNLVSYQTNWVASAPSSPAPGTYLGTVTKSDGKYSYWAIIGTIYTPIRIYSTNTYDHIFWGSTDITVTNKYVADSLSGQTAVIGDNVILALPNGLNMSGQDTFSIMPMDNVPVVATSGNPYPAGANVLVYSGGTSCTIGGNGIINQPGFAADFILFCAPTVTTFSLNGNGGFNGVLVAPSVDLTLNGSGTTPIDFVGTAMVNSATLNGHFRFHYDECLEDQKNNPRYFITAWNEIK